MQAKNCGDRLKGQRPIWLFLAGFSLAISLWNLNGRSFENKEYRRYPEVAWEIVKTGDWILLKHQNKLYVDKPPLHFWKIAVCYKAFGVGPFPARLPSAVFGFFGVLLCAYFAKKIFRDNEIALLSGLLLLCSYGWIWWARRTRIDLEFSVLFSAAVILGYLGSQSLSFGKACFFYSAGWLFTGLAFLDKGPIAFSASLPQAVYFVLKMKRREISFSRIVPFFLSMPWFLIPVGPWWWLLGNHPGFSEWWSAFVSQKIATRREGLFYYVWEFPAKFFPSTLALVLGALAFFRSKPGVRERRRAEFPLLWFLSYFFLINLTAVKNHRYLLPVFIPASLLTAWSFKRAIELGIPRILKIEAIWQRILLAGACVSLLVPLGVSVVFGTSVLFQTALLAALLLAGLKAVPYRSAAWCISATVILCSIDAMDTARDPVTSPILQLLQEAKQKGLDSSEVVFCEGAENAKSLFELYTGKSWGKITSFEEALKSKAAKLVVFPKNVKVLAEFKRRGINFRELGRYLIVFRSLSKG